MLPPQAVLVGQNIRQDVQWLGFEQGRDYSGMMDLQGLYRVWNPQFKSYSMWGQDQLAKVLLQWPKEEGHNAATDALKSLRLFHCYFDLQSRPGAWDAACDALVKAPIEPSFARQNPVYDGVCMGNRKTCKCGAPFFS